MKQILVLDFDGFLCDGLKESILVTWNGYHTKTLSAFSDQGFASVPGAFVERFKYLRNFAKHVSHFFVPFLDDFPLLSTQEDFDAVYASIPSKVLDEFVERVTCYRDQVRNERRAMWLQYHTLYPGIQTFLADLRVPPYIVTAKDSESVVEILKNNAIVFDKANIFGEQRSKLAALGEIQQREHVNISDIHFYDDHLMNVQEARNAGYRAYWATWGYHVPEHVQKAQQWGIEGLSLTEFVNMKEFH